MKISFWPSDIITWLFCLDERVLHFNFHPYHQLFVCNNKFLSSKVYILLSLPGPCQQLNTHNYITAIKRSVHSLSFDPFICSVLRVLSSVCLCPSYVRYASITITLCRYTSAYKSCLNFCCLAQKPTKLTKAYSLFRCHEFSAISPSPYRIVVMRSNRM